MQTEMAHWAPKGEIAMQQVIEAQAGGSTAKPVPMLHGVLAAHTENCHRLQTIIAQLDGVLDRLVPLPAEPSTGPNPEAEKPSAFVTELQSQNQRMGALLDRLGGIANRFDEIA